MHQQKWGAFYAPLSEKNWIGNPSVSLLPIIHAFTLQIRNVNDGKI
jgi:hypothetical protein